MARQAFQAGVGEHVVEADHLRVGRKKRVRRELEMSNDLQRLLSIL